MNYIDLSGSWKLRLAGAGESGVPAQLPEEIRATLPGDNITALWKAGLIPDPYVGRNELDLQWIGRCDWSFETEFTVSKELLRFASHRFVAHSLDTVATVSVNGTEIGGCDSMFVGVDLPIAPGLLHEGQNHLTIAFASPERIAIERARQLPYPLPYSEYPVNSPHRNLLRKAQCHAGWDWGPCLMGSGAFGPLGIAAGDEPILLGASAVPTHREEWFLQVTPRFSRSAEEREVELRVSVASPDGATVTEFEGAVTAGHDMQSSLSVPVGNPELWWPNGLGDQPLYTVTVEAEGRTVTRRVGFRDLSVDLSPDDTGSRFTIVVNGRPIFAKGANWIPQDGMPGRAEDADLEWQIRSARDAHMNMLRVWGGGVYESERFYDLCDQYGLLVWQDFMFACALYPAHPEFLASVRKEVRYQVRRLRDRASIALWCGNNENVGALNWFEVSRKNRDRYIVDYDRLNEGAVGTVCREEDPSRLFWPSSPTDGPGEYGDDWKADARGDMHYWSVWHGGEQFGSYRSVLPRFCSEFGFQSFPSLSTVEKYATQEQQNVTAPDMEHHQRHPRGNTIIMHTMARYYRFPASLGQQIYLSQVQQANAIRTAVEFWRSRRPRSMGALFWQLNDNWPVASWSSLEYQGKWKLLHHAARRFYAPTLLTATPIDPDGGPQVLEDQAPAAWQIHLINETTSERAGAAQVRFFSFDGTHLGETSGRDIRVETDSSSLVFTLTESMLPAARSECFAIATFAGEETCWFFLDHPKRCNLHSAAITIDRLASGNGVELTTDVPAFEVAVDAGVRAGRFEDNMILLMPGSPRALRWIPNGADDDAFVPDTCTVTALNNIG